MIHKKLISVSMSYIVFCNALLFMILFDIYMVSNDEYFLKIKLESLLFYVQCTTCQ